MVSRARVFSEDMEFAQKLDVLGNMMEERGEDDPDVIACMEELSNDPDFETILSAIKRAQNAPNQEDEKDTK